MSERLDMSEFEKQFSDSYSSLMPNDDFERLAFLKERIQDITEVMAFRSDEKDAIKNQHEQIQNLIREFERIISNLRRLRTPLDAQLGLIARIDRRDQTTKSAYERELARLQAEIDARRQFMLQRTEIEEATRDFPWRVGVDGKKALPHQIEGAHRLLSAGRAILGDKPGLGKTLQAIMTIDLLRTQGKGQKVLIFTPKSVLRDFERAFERWSPGKFVHVLNQTLKGIKSELLDIIAHLPEAIVITNYEVWRKDLSIKHKLIACGFDTIFLDEAHVLKGEKSLVTQGIREIIYTQNRCPLCGSGNVTQMRATDGPFSAHVKCGHCGNKQEKFGEFCSIKNVYPMSGTTILNKPDDLFSLLNMVDREGFPSRNSFLKDYCEKQYDYKKEKYYYSFGDGGSDRLLSKLGMKYTARDRDSAGVIMPPQEIKHHYLELDPEKYPRQSKFIEILRERARLAFSSDHQMTMQGTLAWYTRMRQAASWPDGIQIKGCMCIPECPYEDDGKQFCIDPQIIFPPKDAPPIGESILMDESEDIINEAVDSGDRIVVFSMFKSVLAELERRCENAGLRHAKIIGGVSDKNRQIYIDDFNANQTKFGEHKYDVLLCQYQTAQVGLSLHGAQQLLCVEREWNPGKEMQTLDRLRRIDSEFNSTVHLLHCAGTATDLIDGLQDQKKGILDGFESDVNLHEAMRKFLEG